MSSGSPYFSSSTSPAASRLAENGLIQEWSSEQVTHLTLASQVEPLLGISQQVIDGEAVLADLLSNRYFNLNATGNDIWQGIANGNSLGHIAEQLVIRYAIIWPLAQETVLTFVRVLADASLIVIYRPCEVGIAANLAGEVL